jgi:GTPase SAR1 family protein
LSQGADKLKLVVVGDQSTGKSSVLQAITEIPFPIDDKMCTRFATEVVLKRTLPDHPTSIEVSIIPAPDEPPERKKTLVAWQPEGFDQTGTLNKEAMKSVFKQVRRLSSLDGLG